MYVKKIGISVGYRPRRERLGYWILLIATWHSVLLFAGKKHTELEEKI
jgi:hypothetical protein